MHYEGDYGTHIAWSYGMAPGRLGLGWRQVAPIMRKSYAAFDNMCCLSSTSEHHIFLTDIGGTKPPFLAKVL